jgi:CRP-like cAMP-binding protein
MIPKETPSPEPAFRSSVLLAGLARREVEAIRAFFSRREIDPGTYLFRQGEPALVYYLVLEGLVKGVQSGPEGAEVILHVLGPGDLIGALPTLGRPAYPGSAVALSRLIVLATTARDFEQVLREHPQLAVNLLKSAADVIQLAHARLREASTLPVEQRIARTLWRLVPLCGEPGAEGLVLDLPLTRRDLAGLSGTTIYTVSRALGGWERQGWLRIDRRRLIVLAPASLEQACGE